jgi:TolB-like protein
MSASEPLSAGAAFLSYAREDAAAAGRIADALRGFGVEVWLDQSELRGGDAWDSKIRRQIRECALFLAIISKTTQGRGEGYFRREWKLAVERTHDMAVGMPFLIPVVVDETTEAEAIVPDEFMRVQWTRLKGGAPTPQFVELVRRLLDSPRVASPAARPASLTGTARMPGRGVSAPMMGGVALAVVAVAVGAFLILRPRAAEPTAAAPVAAAKPAEAPSPSPAPSDKSIAVLPFENMSADKDNAFFADGMHEDVITNLSKIRELKVIARSSVMAYRDPAARDLKKIAAELGVATILEGSVQRAGTKVRVTAQLTDARTNANLWAESYDRDLSDIFAVQAEIAQDIANALKANLTESERAFIANRPTQNQEAYDLYLRAHLVDINTGLASKAQMDAAIDLYERAVAKDPTFALAYTQLAIANTYQYWFGFLDPSPARLQRAQAAVDAAVRLAPDLPETHTAQGAFAYRVRRDWAGALSEFLKAQEGLPNDAELAYWIGLTYRRLGRGPESVPYFERAVALNPRGVASVAMLVNTLSYLRRFPEGVRIGSLYPEMLIGSYSMTSDLMKARYEVDGDRGAFLAGSKKASASLFDPTGVQHPYVVAMAAGDYPAAAQALTDPELKGITGPENVLIEPVLLHRALVAFMMGHGDEARAFADDAIVILRSAQVTPRQEAFRLMNLAQAEAYSGRAVEAVRDATASVADATAHDAYDAMVLQGELGRVLSAVGEREKALDLLRTMIAGPCFMTPGEIRYDPLWSRLKDDPRFEEILKSAKPL